MITGLVNGIKAHGIAALAEVTKLATGLKDAFKSALGIHSPSKVFSEFGGYTAEGYAQGIESQGGRVEDAIDSMVTAPSTRASSKGGASASSRGAKNTYQIVNHFYGRSEDAELVAKIREVVTELFVGTAIEMGAPVEPEGN